ncbi:MAG: SUMF1/EgtB/PvdO family nonheme iron enzyme [Nitrospinae bacterium]|nr:SUMF1/EgtB/PvdO family nonheme iron enzyme [Nitrospinota bacterium]
MAKTYGAFPEKVSGGVFRFLLVLLVFYFVGPKMAYADVAQLLESGEAAVAKKDFGAAEESFGKALAEEPDSLKAMQFLAEIKAKLEKYEEANQLIEKILALPVSSGRNVLVYLEGETEPREAEIVDENVLAPPQPRTNMKNYVEPVSREPVSQYRIFFKKSGQIELVPKSQARIKYLGVPRMIHLRMSELQMEVKKRLIAVGPASKGSEDMVEIKGGCFTMGSDNGHVDEKPKHEVCVSGFKMDKYEVSQSAFQSKMKTNPSQYIGADLPADSVTWDEAMEYCKKLGKRLPTEAEWEYAARANAKSEFYTGDAFSGKQGNFCDAACSLNIRNPAETDGFKFSAPVGSFPPNPFGLHDMAGNVSEWVADWMLENYYQISPNDNPKGPETGESKVIRGGAWDTNLDSLRSANRAAFWPDFRNEAVGFRCAANP